MNTTIEKSISSERVALKAMFPSGGWFSFSASRAGSTIGYNTKNAAQGRERQAILSAFARPQRGESAAQLLGRIEAFVRGVSSTTELCAAIKSSTIQL